MPVMFARDLARARIWGILFRLPCAGFMPGRAYDQRPTGRVRSHPWNATNSGLAIIAPRLRQGDTPDRGAGGPRQVTSGAVTGAMLDRPESAESNRRAGGTRSRHGP